MLFADDTNIFYRGDDPNSIANIINDDLTLYNDWFLSNKLSLNVSKTNYIVFGPFGSTWDQKLQFNNIEIERVYKTKFLGVFIDSKLSWIDHIRHVTFSISKGIGIISKFKHFFPRTILRTIYQTLILPHLSYCCTVWSGAKASTLNKLIVLQKRAIRHIMKVGYRDHTSNLFSSLNLVKLSDLIKINLATLAYRALHNNLPSTLNKVFSTNNNIHRHYTRQSGNIHCVPCHTTIVRNNPFNLAIDIWNSLSTRVKGCYSLCAFKKNLRKEMLANY